MCVPTIWICANGNRVLSLSFFNGSQTNSSHLLRILARARARARVCPVLYTSSENISIINNFQVYVKKQEKNVERNSISYGRLTDKRSSLINLIVEI